MPNYDPTKIPQYSSDHPHICNNHPAFRRSPRDVAIERATQITKVLTDLAGDYWEFRIGEIIVEAVRFAEGNIDRLYDMEDTALLKALMLYRNNLAEKDRSTIL